MDSVKKTQRLKFEIAYDGTDFCGWQTQRDPCSQPTIQDELHRAAEKIFRQAVHFQGSGRTDSGVHAWAQIAHADLPGDFDFTKMDIPAAFRTHLPESISIKRVWLAPEEFHAQHSAQKKTYKYLIYHNKFPHPWLRRYVYWYRHPLNFDRLFELGDLILGEHDFACFQGRGASVSTTVREILDLNWKLSDSGMVELKITGTGFLKQMVRNIVGTLLDLQRASDGPERLLSILESKDRTKAGPTAPAHGLSLWRVYYDRDLDRRCHRL